MAKKKITAVINEHKLTTRHKVFDADDSAEDIDEIEKDIDISFEYIRKNEDGKTHQESYEKLVLGLTQRIPAYRNNGVEFKYKSIKLKETSFTEETYLFTVEGKKGSVTKSAVFTTIRVKSREDFLFDYLEEVMRTVPLVYAPTEDKPLTVELILAKVEKAIKANPKLEVHSTTLFKEKLKEVTYIAKKPDVVTFVVDATPIPKEDEDEGGDDEEKIFTQVYDVKSDSDKIVFAE